MFEGILQPGHLLLILFVALIVFGPKKLPELGKGLGEAIRGFKKSLNEDDPPTRFAPAPQKTETEPVKDRQSERS
ncbi:MAG TPA: twin-arginine translocase TatA/TatE family subunit [Candidatus Binatia bacterium]|jgi:sec-independent protein translocase protein TatA